MNRACKNAERTDYTPVVRMTDAGKKGPATFDGTDNKGAKPCPQVGKSSPFRDPKTLHYAPKD